jgi:hypothetical protein
MQVLKQARTIAGITKRIGGEPHYFSIISYKEAIERGGVDD